MNKRGFTLIELLVVVAIIGILASIVIASLNTARAKGRDARRIADIRTIQLALETYYSDNTKYPVDIYASSGGLSPTYITVMPKDPGTGVPYSYVSYNSKTTPISNCNGTTNPPPVFYHLGALLEQQNNIYLTQDSDFPALGSWCQGGSGTAFDGTTQSGASGSSCSSNPGTPAPAGELCYDVTN